MTEAEKIIQQIKIEGEYLEVGDPLCTLIENLEKAIHESNECLTSPALKDDYDKALEKIKTLEEAVKALQEEKENFDHFLEETSQHDKFEDFLQLKEFAEEIINISDYQEAKKFIERFDLTPR